MSSSCRILDSLGCYSLNNPKLCKCTRYQVTNYTLHYTSQEIVSNTQFTFLSKQNGFLYLYIVFKQYTRFPLCLIGEALGMIPKKQSKTKIGTRVPFNKWVLKNVT